jgi:C4-type Zn-finger protein
MKTKPEALKFPCPFCKQDLVDLHPTKYYNFPDQKMIEVFCCNDKCSFGKHYKSIDEKQASSRTSFNLTAE